MIDNGGENIKNLTLTFFSRYYRILQVLLLQLALKGVAAVCPALCSCELNEVECSGLHFAEFLPHVDVCTKAFIIKDSNMSDIKSPGYLKCSTELSHLHIVNCGQFAIYPEAFAAFTSLYWLKLEDNAIHSLETGVFTGLAHLEVLDIERNGLKIVKNGAFSGLEELRALSLSYNMLTSLEDGVFVPLIHLKQLKLIGNCFVEVVPGYFLGLFTLNKLHLNGNHIQALHRNSFNTRLYKHQHPLGKLQFLYLQNNKIQNIESKAFDGLRNVVYLDLSNNKLLKLHQNCFQGLIKLNYLRFENTSIKDLYSGAFNGLEQLQELHMARNNFFTLRSKYFEGLINLKVLKISGHVYDIQENAFKTTPSLVFLNLDNNRLEELHLNVTIDLINLETLSLSKNKFQALENFMFKYLNNLKVLFLDDNDVSIIHDNAFFGLRNLKKLSLRNNNICTLSNDTPIAYFSPKSFRKPFMKLVELTHLDLYGNCLENLALYSFSNLPKLSVLNLGNNRLFEVEESVIMSSPALKRLVLAGNPLHCDCNLLRIRNWLLQKNVNTSLEPTCATGLHWRRAFQTMSCVTEGKETRFLKNLGLFLIGPAAIVVIGLLSWVYTCMRKKENHPKNVII